MMLLFLDGPDAERASYFQYQGESLLASGKLSLPDSGLREEATTVVIPGQQVTTRRVNLPKGRPRQVLRAIPYIIEDELASPLERVHIATGVLNDRNALVSVMEHELLSRYLDRLGEMGIQPDQLIPDYFLIPHGEKPVARRLDGRLLVRLPDGSGCSFGDINQPLVLDALAMGGKTIDDLHFDTGPTTGDIPLNLLQGQYRPAGFRASGGFPWRRPTIAATVFLTLLVLYLLSAGYYFHHRSDRLDAEAADLYRQLFPADKRVVSIRRQMEGHLSAGGERDPQQGFFELLTIFTHALASIEGDNRVRHILFEQKEGNLLLELQTDSLANAQSLKDRVDEAGASLDILSATRNDIGLVARLRLQKPG